MRQLLMRWDEAPLTEIALPEGYVLHNFHRGGDAALSERDFAEGWIRTVVKVCPFDMSTFGNYYDDARIPDDGFFVVLHETDGIVATATAQIGEHTPDSGTLHMVATDERHSGKKLGKIATVAVMKYLLARGIKTIYLTTDDFRLAAVKVYRSLGFEPVIDDCEMRERWDAVFAKIK